MGKLMPTPEQWASLSWTERTTFRVIDFINRTPAIRRLFTRGASTLGATWVELTLSRLAPHYGFDHFQKLDPSRGVLLVANHRTYFDLFPVAARLFKLYGAHHHIYFPTRSTFFYTSLLGLTVNIPVATGAMYPPISRGPRKRAWNKFAVDLMVELLQDPANLIGLHPEGTRGQAPDPYQLLPARPGAGELIYRARPNVVPVFLCGFPRYAWHLPLLNAGLLGRPRALVHMVMGEPMDFSTEWNLPASPELYQSISDRVMGRVAELGEEERRIRKAYDAAFARGERWDPKRLVLR